MPRACLRGYRRVAAAHQSTASESILLVGFWRLDLNDPPNSVGDIPRARPAVSAQPTYSLWSLARPLRPSRPRPGPAGEQPTPLVRCMPAYKTYRVELRLAPCYRRATPCR